MKREDLDNLLKELTKEDLSTDRQLEIFKTIQDDFDTKENNYNTLVENSDKLKGKFEDLRKKKVEEFFNVGVESSDAKKEFESSTNEPAQVPTYESLVEDPKIQM